MDCDFYKMNGLGNDFVVLDRLDITESPAEDFGATARRVCNRRLSVGADGLLVIIKDPNGADARMRIFNADGTEAQMCGNGIRCVALHLYSLTGKETMDIATMSGVKEVSVHRDNGMFMAVVDMGKANFTPTEIPVIYSEDVMLDAPVDVCGHTVCLTAVSMGNPHGVIFVDDVEVADVHITGSALETHEIWPEKANIEFAQVLDRHHLHMRAWERGVGETEACGTGACAAAAAAVATGRADYPVDVHLAGGHLLISQNEQGHTLMCGPAEYCFKGTFNI